MTRKNLGQGVVVGLVTLLVALGSGGAGEGQGAKEKAVITVISTAFAPGQAIPKKYTGEGENVSPTLAWSGAPAGTKELALICDDPDAPRKEPFVHWVLYNIHAGVSILPEAGNGGATEGKNGTGKSGYTGPMPPPGSGVHHYHFKIYALDKALGLAPGLGKDDVLNAMIGHVIGEGE